jgi:hypothetical protein
LSHKFGYGTDVETFKKEASDKFSLLKDGTLDKPVCAKLLLVNVSCTPIFLMANADDFEGYGGRNLPGG